MPLFFDPTMILLIPALILAVWAQFKVSSTFKKYSKVQNNYGFSGYDIATKMLIDNGIYDVKVEAIAGNLTDHYDPSCKIVRLSESVYEKTTISALSVATHEVGHAIQHNLDYAPLTLRSKIYPIANIGSSSAFFLFLIGIFMNSGIFLQIGIALFTFAVIFHIVTLPVEFNASKRALEYLQTNKIVTVQEFPQAKAVLSAAAMTYVASTLMAVLQLVRMLLIARDE